MSLELLNGELSLWTLIEIIAREVCIGDEG